MRNSAPHPVGSRGVFPSEEAHLAFEARMEVIKAVRQAMD
jgi:hypothetical protein